MCWQHGYWLRISKLQHAVQRSPFLYPKISSSPAIPIPIPRVSVLQQGSEFPLAAQLQQGLVPPVCPEPFLPGIWGMLEHCQPRQPRSAGSVTSLAAQGSALCQPFVPGTGKVGTGPELPGEEELSPS